MKKLNKVLVMVIAAIMTLAMSATAFAATQTKALSPADADNATITINNPANGETYSLYKLFDATVSTDGQISYQGTVPSGLSAYFKADANGYISPIGEIVVTDASGKVTDTKMTDGLKTALETWAKGTASAKVIEEVSDGSEALEFTGLPYGYYVMITTHKSDKVGDAEAKSLISVTSTKPNAVINDKNVNKPSADKEADGVAYNIGDTITYTATFDAPNYMPSTADDAKDGDSEQVVSYTIKDTLPSFLSNVQVTKVEIKQPGVATNVELDTTNLQFGATTKSFDVPWVEETVPTENHKYTSKYKAGSQIIVTYTAKLTAEANVGAANKNKISIMPNVDRGNDTPPGPYQEKDEWNAEATIYTHAAALQKKANSEDGDNLAGAEFSFKGLIVTGVPGFYTVVSYDPKSTADGTVMKCDANGQLIIAGVAADATTPVKLVGTETKAPEGFNKIEGTFELTTIVMSTQTTTNWENKTTYYDADGNIVDEVTTGGSSITRREITSISDIPATSIQKVVNKQGVELPGTGGIGTTIFYILGSLLVVGCGIVLISRKRMENNK